MELIYEYKNSLSKELCEKMIELFESDESLEQKGPGITLGGINKDIKLTTDLGILEGDIRFKNYLEIVRKELLEKIKDYITSLKKLNYFNDTIRGVKDYGFKIQKYERNKGYYKYHDDFFVLFTKGEYRIASFLWYLNTVEIGGETEFMNTIRIKPEAGKLIIFPASWTYPHTGLVPESSDKYILTGFLYISQDDNV